MLLTFFVLSIFLVKPKKIFFINFVYRDPFVKIKVINIIIVCSTTVITFAFPIVIARCFWLSFLY